MGGSNLTYASEHDPISNDLVMTWSFEDQSMVLWGPEHGPLRTRAWSLEDQSMVLWGPECTHNNWESDAVRRH